MKHKQALLLAAIVAPLALVLPADKVAFHPEKGSSVSKTFETKQTLELDDMTVKVNGTEQPMPGEMQMTMEMAYTVGVTDEYGEIADGRPTTLKRTFDDISSTGNVNVDLSAFGQENQDKAIEAKSVLEGKTVVFTWDAEKKEYTKAFADKSGDAELLAGLDEDMDFRGMLPDKEVSKGDTWDIDVKLLKSVLLPGGDLKLKPEDGEEDVDMMGMGDMDFSQMFSDLLDGTAKGEYQGTRDVEGTSCGVIHLTVKISGSRDMSDMVGKALEKAPEGAPKPDIDHVDVEFGLDGEGELLWDLRAGYARGFTLDGTLEITMDTAMAMAMGDQKLKFDQTMEMSGNYSAKMTAK